MSDIPEKLSALAHEIDESWWEPKRQLLSVASVHIRAAEAQIESLQRSNERLKAQRMASIEYGANLQRLIERFCAGRMDTLDRSDTPHHYDMLSKAAAITPEMRERIERKLADMQAESPLPIGGELVDLLRDLLGEQG